MSTETYTYQGGTKVDLTYATNHFISRSTKEDLLEHDFKPLQAMSVHSWSVATTAHDLDHDLVRARRFAPAYPAYIVIATGTPLLVTDRIFVRFRTEVSTIDAHRFADHFELTPIERLTRRDFLFRIPSECDSVDIVRRMTEEHQSEVELVDHDLNIRPHPQELVATDPDLPQQWHLLSDHDDGLVRRCALLDCEGAWKLNGYGDPNVVIGIVDAGCDLSDPNFGPGKFAEWAVMLDGELLSSGAFIAPGNEEIMDPPRVHGTLCATLAAASINDFGGAGVAPGCSLIPVKWQDLGAATTFPQSLFSKVINFLRERADVVSNSWARSANAYWPPYICDSLEDAALNGRQGKGMVWVWAAGNRNTPIHHRGTVRVPVALSGDGDTLVVSDSSARFTNSFVGIPGVLHVGAISSLGQRCHYSNYGTGLDLVAPSGNYHLYGRDTVAGLDVLAPLGKRGLMPFPGTSAAAPQVAGVAALVRSANPELTSTEVVSILRRTADKDLDMNGYEPSSRPTDPDPRWDVSPIRPFHSGEFKRTRRTDGLWSPWFGYGKVNARKAVEASLRSRR
jgi:hypothetical protein